MRKLLTLIAVLIGFSAAAQSRTDREHRLCLHSDGSFALPVGSFGNGTDNIITEPAKHGWGGTFGFGKYFGPDIYVGIFLGNMSVKLDANAVAQHMRDVLGVPDAYNTATLDGDKYAIKQMGIECGKNFRFQKIELEPYVVLGLGAINGLPNAHFRRKFKGDNYYQQLDYSFQNDENEFNFFYPTFGAHVRKALVDWLYLSAGLAFSTGSYTAQVTTISSDLEGNSQTVSSSYKQSVSTLQLSLGLQMRFGKK